MSVSPNHAREAAEVLRTLVGGIPDVAVVLGTGLGGFADTLQRPQRLATTDLPHWPRPSVDGHAGDLVTGRLHGRDVLVLAGRVHLYEGHDAATVVFPVRALGVLGVRTLVLTNATGGVNVRFRVGTLMAVDDHLNLTGANPLVGPHQPEFGPRFPDMTHVYAPRLRAIAAEAARNRGIVLEHGVYAGLLGPSYETPSEIRALRVLGADVVGMSTVCEAIAARQMGMDVLGLSLVTNMAAGVTDQPVDEADVLTTAAAAEPQMIALLDAIVERV